MSEKKFSIPTEYAGTKFRSKLEARYARFFDMRPFDGLGCERKIPWVYEEEGFDLGNGVWYLPDFWLPEAKAFVEVKGVLDDIDEIKLFRLAEVCSEKNITVVLATSPAPTWRIVLPTPWERSIIELELNDSFEVSSEEDAMLLLCGNCAVWHFDMDGHGLRCHLCGATGDDSASGGSITKKEDGKLLLHENLTREEFSACAARRSEVQP